MADGEAPHHYKFNIKMNCSGCSGAIDRVLKKTEGLSSILSNFLPLCAKSTTQASSPTPSPSKTKLQMSMPKKVFRTKLS